MGFRDGWLRSLSSLHVLVSIIKILMPAHTRKEDPEGPHCKTDTLCPDKRSDGISAMDIFSDTSHSRTWPELVPYRKYLSLPSTQQMAVTGEPEMKVASVEGEGVGDQTLTTPDWSAETTRPPTLDTDTRTTELLCSEYSSCPNKM